MPTEANWYHAHVDAVSRSDGKSAVGLVAYITGQALKDERTGIWCTRNHPGEVLDWGSTAPDSAAAYLTDKQTLSRAWNAVEKSENRINSHVAQHWNVAGSREFSEDDHRAVTAAIAQKLTDRYGVLATWGIHKPTDHGDDANWHYHFAHNMRDVSADGFGAKVRQIVDKKTRIDETRWVRGMIAETVNDRLALINSNERISHESYAARGIDRDPTQHLGNKQNLAELRGHPTAGGDRNREIRERNREAEVATAALDERIVQIKTQIHDLTLRRLRMVANEVTDMEFENHQSVEIEEEEKRRLHQLRDHREQLEEFYKEQDERQRRYGQQKSQIESEQQRREASGDIADANSRWMKAAGENYDARRPEASLATAVGREAAQFRKEQDTLRQQEREAKDPEQKKFLELRRHIEACDYMALQHEKMAGISGAIIGRRDNEISNRDRERAQEWSRIGTGLRDERDSLKEQIKDREAEKGWSNARAAAGDRPGNLPQDRGNPKDRSPTQPMQFPESANDALWRSRLTGWAERDTWFDNYGPKPGEGNFQGPKHLGEQYAAIRSQREWRPVGSGEVLDRALRTKWDNAENRLVVFAPVGGRNKAADIGPLSSDADKPIGIGTPGLSARDIEAVLAYNQEAKKNGLTPTNAGRREAIDEWRNLDADYREDGVKAQQRDATREGARDPRIDKSSDDSKGMKFSKQADQDWYEKLPEDKRKAIDERHERQQQTGQDREQGTQLDAGGGNKRSGGRGGASY